MISWVPGSAFHSDSIVTDSPAPRSNTVSAIMPGVFPARSSMMTAASVAPASPMFSTVVENVMISPASGVVFETERPPPGMTRSG